MTKIDYEYHTTEERIRAYLRVPEIDRLRWLEELCAFTSMVRQAPAVYPHSGANENKADGGSQT